MRTPSAQSARKISPMSRSRRLLLIGKLSRKSEVIRWMEEYPMNKRCIGWMEYGVILSDLFQFLGFLLRGGIIEGSGDVEGEYTVCEG